MIITTAVISKECQMSIKQSGQYPIIHTSADNFICTNVIVECTARSKTITRAFAAVPQVPCNYPNNI